METIIGLGIFVLIVAGMVVVVLIKKKKDSPVTPEVPIWTPPQTPGLHLIVDNPNRKAEYYEGQRILDGLLLGDYGLQIGGARISKWNGLTNTFTTELQTDRESIYDMFDPGDGLHLACTEHFGDIYKRNASGVWELKYTTGRHDDLMFYFRQAPDGTVYANWNGFSNQLSGLVKSTDKGNTWQPSTQFPAGMELCGMCVDGNSLADVLLGGKIGWAAIIVDGTGKTIVSYDSGNQDGYQNWAVIRKDNIINAGTWNCTDKADGSYINAINPNGSGKQCMPPLYRSPGEFYIGPLGRFIEAMKIGPDGIRYAVITKGWGEEGQALLVSSPDAYTWTLLATIPCPMIVEMDFSDGGVFLYGGQHEGYGLTGYGRVYFFKF